MNKKELVLINGTFDVLHPGHLRLFAFAKSLGDFLLVAIDTDRRISNLKGPLRPINNFNFRFEMLMGLKDVDFVDAFDSDEELENIIKTYEPDIMVKGSDYRGKQIVGQTLVPEIIFMERTAHSTTKIIQSISNR